jgi:predicted amidohydrolase
VAGSIKLREHGRVYNALAFIGPDGRVLGTYSKTFLTRGEVEQGLTPGPGAVAVDTPVGRLGGAICFDLNFTELVEQNARLRPDIIAFASMYHGGLMQGYWAYQCRANFVSALPFIGGGILDPFGRPVALTDCYTKVVMADVNLDRVMAHLDFNQEKFLAIRKKYGRDVCIDIPANIGSALITSTVPDRTAAEIAAEFELELLDDYFASSIRDNRKSRVSSVECRVSSVEWKSQ